MADSADPVFRCGLRRDRPLDCFSAGFLALEVGVAALALAVTGPCCQAWMSGYLHAACAGLGDGAE